MLNKLSLTVYQPPNLLKFLIFYEQVIPELFEFQKDAFVEGEYFFESDHFAAFLKLQQSHKSPNDQVEAADADVIFLKGVLAEYDDSGCKVSLDVSISDDKNVNFVYISFDIFGIKSPEYIQNIVMNFVDILSGHIFTLTSL